ncbi:Metallo-dependent hydrolase [Lentinus tigrinus ALCF2SS1-7]|uniref:adenosine deaminase n=1 Tax=Lentinus tigrinus ALCF2SS1-6 TaxID=1328759 RepID=A0A5C2SN54_9APHY|nr:Metallo-dependent hydrolase [Lentinus tigrinus ALCF2SS1-6]RPD67951.1 Metallo-dependent hydrolase [Lentinus tigrinus ALCF2SS1-7]
MEEYLRERHELMLKDRALRHDHAAHRKPSLDEIEADAVLRKIRTTEAKTVWDSKRVVEHPHGFQQMFPGMEFLTARSTIMSTKLFAILSEMPKGGLLHAHLDATVRADVLLKLAMKQPAIHVRAPGRLSMGTFKTVLPQFRALPQTQWTQLPSITDPSYDPNTWVPINNARRNFSDALGGPEGFDRWVIGALMIEPAEAYGTHNSTAKASLRIWEKFGSTFMVSDGLIRFVPIWTEYVREFLLSSIADGISYVEPRILFWHKQMVGADGEENVPHRIWFQMYERILNEVKASLAAQGRADEFVGSRIIYSTLRIGTPEELEWYTEDCLALKQEFPHLVAGFDIVGHEDSLEPLIKYADVFLRFKQRQKELGVGIPFMFHAGETLGDGSAADVNLYDAILLGTKRIGHGYSIYKHPHLMEICREKGICLEMCPISNEILRLAGSMPMHPLPAIMNHGVHVALCSDDPAVFGNMGLTFDFFQVFVASELNGLYTLRELVWDSIRFSSLGEQEKDHALAMLEKRWARFVKYILEYGTAERLRN